MIDVAIIDYKMSNLFSVKAACNKVGLSSVITSNENEILNAKIAILPGVGAFAKAMKSLTHLRLNNTIFKFIETGKPFIGICLGLQLLFDRSEEFGNAEGLGVISGEVKKFKFFTENEIKYPVPQIGWNKVYNNGNSWENTYLENIKVNDFMYFVHSYYVIPDDNKIELSFTNYGGNKYCSSIKKDNIFACQFHPEKSGSAGIAIYKSIFDKVNESK